MLSSVLLLSALAQASEDSQHAAPESHGTHEGRVQVAARGMSCLSCRLDGEAGGLGGGALVELAVVPHVFSVAVAASHVMHDGEVTHPLEVLAKHPMNLGAGWELSPGLGGLVVEHAETAQPTAAAVANVDLLFWGHGDLAVFVEADAILSLEHALTGSVELGSGIACRF